MAHDEDLALRLRAALADRDAVTEKRMFGGLAFLVHGHMAVCASGTGGLLVRVDPATSALLVEQQGVERMVMGGREMDGWLRVATAQLEDDAALRSWVDRGLAVVAGLPPKGA